MAEHVADEFGNDALDGRERHRVAQVLEAGMRHTARSSMEVNFLTSEWSRVGGSAYYLA
jgi:hypothetical protein